MMPLALLTSCSLSLSHIQGKFILFGKVTDNLNASFTDINARLTSVQEVINMVRCAMLLKLTLMFRYSNFTVSDMDFTNCYLEQIQNS